MTTESERETIRRNIKRSQDIEHRQQALLVALKRFYVLLRNDVFDLEKSNVKIRDLEAHMQSEGFLTGINELRRNHEFELVINHLHSQHGDKGLKWLLGELWETIHTLESQVSGVYTVLKEHKIHGQPISPPRNSQSAPPIRKSHPPVYKSISSPPERHLDKPSVPPELPKQPMDLPPVLQTPHVAQTTHKEVPMAKPISIPAEARFGPKLELEVIEDAVQQGELDINAIQQSAEDAAAALEELHQQLQK